MDSKKEFIGFVFKTSEAIETAKKLTLPLKFDVYELNEKNQVHFFHDSEVFKALMVHGESVFNSLCERVFRMADTSLGFEKELENLLNKYSRDNNSNTQDFVLAKYLCNCLKAFDIAKNMSISLQESNVSEGNGFDDYLSHVKS